MSYASAVLADSPASYYKMNESAATTTVTDYGSLATNATAVANTSTLASSSMLPSGEGGSFTAGSAGLWSVAVNYSGAPFTTNHAQTTLEFWASFPSFSAVYVPVEYTTAFDNGSNHGFGTYSTNDSFANGFWYGGGYSIPGTSFYEMDLNTSGGGSGNPTTSTAHHFVQVMDPTFSPNGRVQLYIDNVLLNTSPVGVPSNSGTGGAWSNSGLYCGGRAIGSLFIPSGTKISNVAVYPSLLNSTQVNAHYQASFPGPPPPPKVINNAPRIRSSYW